VNVDADVSLVRDERLARVNTDAYSHGTCASPCVSTSTPPCRENESRSTRRCAARTSAYWSPSSSNRRVEPSMSVKSRVTVPLGRSTMDT
jgi:hypothetical protein